MSLFDHEIEQSVRTLRNGGTLIYPTDTIWGIGCDATNAAAVGKIYLLKQRTENKSLIILLDDAEKIRHYIREVPAIAWDLLDKVDRPLTIIYPSAMNLAANVIADDGTVAIRVVKNDFCIRLIREFGKPIVSTSANISGTSPPLTYRNIAREILSGADYVVSETLDELHDLKPSQIIKLEVNGEFRIIRE